MNIQALGAVPVLFSVAGEDEMGVKLLELIKEKGIPEQGILTDPNRITTVKSRIIGKGRHIARVDEESTEPITSELEQKLYNAIETELENFQVDVLLFVDYDKGVITPDLFAKVNRLAKQKGIPVAVDPKKRNFSCYKNVALFKPNFQEFTEGTGMNINKDNLEELKIAALKFKKRQNHDLMFITLSELGVFISNGKEDHYMPAAIRQISDVSGAGDTVISVAALGLAANLSPNIMALMSNLAGGLVCEIPGVVPVNKNQLIQLMKSQNL